MNLGIKGRKAIVAGGSAGMGRGTVLALAQEGVEVFASARAADRLHTAAAEISEQAGVLVTPVVADHSTERGRQHWLQSMLQALVGPIELMRLTMDGMAVRHWGRIVNIGTVAAKYPIESRLLSGPARSALANYTAVASRKMARHNVAINNVLPGIFATENMLEYLRTEEFAGMTPDEAISAFADQWKIPAGRLGDPEDFGKIVAVLCSEYAGYIVGQNLVVDGGTGLSIF
jgi:3-oxoacyl-[acyl-carrier protein] reductase